MVTLFRVRKPGKSPVLTQCGKLVIPARQQFMRIALVSNVPYNGILWRVKDPFQRNSELYNAKIGRQMTTVCGGGLHQRVADFRGELVQFRAGELLHIVRGMNFIEKFFLHSY